MSTAVDVVEAEVRELVRRRGLDPFADRAAVRRLVDEVVTDYDDRALTSSLVPLPDPSSAARTVYDAVAGFGPLQRHLDDPEVEEIWVNEPGRVFVARRGRSGLTTTILTEGQVRATWSRRCSRPPAAGLISPLPSHSRANMRKYLAAAQAARQASGAISCTCREAGVARLAADTFLGDDAAVSPTALVVFAAAVSGADRTVPLVGDAPSITAGACGPECRWFKDLVQRIPPTA